MTDRVLALHRGDLNPGTLLVQQLQAADAARPAPVLTVMDPMLLTHAHGMGIDKIQLLRTPDLGVAHGLTARALGATRQLCAEIEDVLAPLLPQVRGAAWCGHWLYNLHMTLFGYAALARAMVQRFEHDSVHLLVPESPHRFGYHSYVPALVLGETLRQHGVPVRHYQNALPAWETPRLPDPAALDGAPDAPGTPELLLHLPTCFYDTGLIADEVRAAARTALVLPSELFDAAFEGLPRSALVAPQVLAERVEPGLRAQLLARQGALSELLIRALGPLLPGSRMVQRQVEAITAALLDHAWFYLALEHQFGARPPRRLLLSNHDGGQHGALLSFARHHGVSTLVLPHAKVFNQAVMSTGHDLLCLHHALQGGDVVDLDGSPLPHAVMDFAEPLQQPARAAAPLRVLGVVLNGLSANALCLVDVAVYLDGLRQLRDWAAGRGVALRIRCRPNGSVLSLICSSLGLEIESLLAYQQGSIADFGRDCDLVLGYDVPTSGAMALLAAGVPVMQALCRRLGAEEWKIVDPAVVPQLPLAELLPQLSQWQSDATALWQMGRDQQLRHRQAAASARPLRDWL